MSLRLGNSIAVATDFIKSNPAVPVYRDGENLYAVIYHIEIGYNKDHSSNVMQYIIIDYKDFSISEEEREELVSMAMEYCREKGIDDDENLKITLLDNEEAENFIEKIFNNMKVIRGLITKKK
ncbi:hypothetical protein EXD82_01595 [Peptacetobacter hominis]|uniref:Uncharacterized protein n=1 Tax=Peptacetobacter hominis TaxID=2743610 RepID=A0A544QXL6_9FIRM|nr:hypothetical protein [Peptacetobacter hominis]TQQ85466.1 hypothetical protein EXD82_01595 [Peptacetobacter hominis]